MVGGIRAGEIVDIATGLVVDGWKLISCHKRLQIKPVFAFQWLVIGIEYQFEVATILVLEKKIW